jgi:hypothetical protein
VKTYSWALEYFYPEDGTDRFLKTQVLIYTAD